MFNEAFFMGYNHDENLSWNRFDFCDKRCLRFALHETWKNAVACCVSCGGMLASLIPLLPVVLEEPRELGYLVLQDL